MPHPVLAEFWTPERLDRLVCLCESESLQFSVVAGRLQLEEPSIASGIITADECQAQYARLAAMRAARDAGMRLGNRERQGVVDVSSLRASMRRELEGQLTPSTTASVSVTVEEEEVDEGPSGFSVLRDSLTASISHIHDAARLQLPSVHDEEEEEEEDEEKEQKGRRGADQGGMDSDEEEEDLRASIRSRVKGAGHNAAIQAPPPSRQRTAARPIVTPPLSRPTPSPSTTRAGASSGLAQGASPAAERRPSLASRLGAGGNASAGSTGGGGQASRARPENQDDWGFNDWVSYQEEQRVMFQEGQRAVFERVRRALSGDSDGGPEGGPQAVRDPVVRSAWERRIREERERARQEEKREEERQRERELTALFAGLAQHEEDPHYDAGFEGIGEDGEFSDEEEGEEEEGPGMQLNIGMDEAELDDLIASFEGQGGEEGGSSEMAEVLQMLDLARNNDRPDNARRSGGNNGERRFLGGGGGERGAGRVRRADGGEGSIETTVEVQLEAEVEVEVARTLSTVSVDVEDVCVRLVGHANEGGNVLEAEEREEASEGTQGHHPHSAEEGQEREEGGKGFGSIWGKAREAEGSGDEDEEEEDWRSMRQKAKGRMDMQQAACGSPGEAQIEREEEEEESQASNSGGENGTEAEEEEEGEGAVEGCTPEGVGEKREEAGVKAEASEEEEREEERMRALGRALFSSLPPPRPRTVTQEEEEEVHGAEEGGEGEEEEMKGGAEEEEDGEEDRARREAAEQRRRESERDNAQALQAYEAKRREYEVRMEEMRVQRKAAQLSTRLDATLFTRSIKGELVDHVAKRQAGAEAQEEAGFGSSPPVSPSSLSPSSAPLPCLPPSLSVPDRASLSVLAFLLPYPSASPSTEETEEEGEEREEQEGYAVVLSLLLHRLCTRASLAVSPVIGEGKGDVCGLVLTCASGYDKAERALTMQGREKGKGRPVVLVAVRAEGGEEAEQQILSQVLGSLPLVSRQHVQGGVVDRVVYSSTTATSEGSGSSLSPSTGSEHGEGGGVLSPLDLFGPGVRLTSALLSSPTNPPSKPDAMVEAEGGADVAVVVMKRHVFKGDGQETTLNAVLERARQSGLILAGARLVYPPTTDHEGSSACGDNATLVLGLRGFDCASRWRDVIGPEKPALAKITDPTSLRAVYGSDRAHNVVVTHATQPQGARRELAYWFGSRRCLPQRSTFCLPTLLRLPSQRCSLHLTSSTLSPSAAFHATWPLLLQRLVSHHGLSIDHVALTGPTAAFSGDDASSHAAAAAFEGPTDHSKEVYQWTISALVSGEGLCPVWLRRAARQTLANLASERAQAAVSSPTLGDAAAGLLALLHVRTSVAFESCDSNFQAGLLPEKEEVQRALAAKGPAPVGKPSTDPEVPQCIGLVVLPDAFAPPAPYFAHLLCELLCPPALHPPPLADRQDPTMAEDQSLELLGLKLVAKPSEALVQAMLECAVGQGDAARQALRSSLSRGPVMAVALRALEGRRRLRALLGPSTHGMAVLEAPRSLRARFGVSDSTSDGASSCCLVAPSAHATYALLAHAFHDTELQDDPTYRCSQAALLPCVSATALPHPLLRFFPPCVPTLETLALLPPHKAVNGDGFSPRGLTRRLGRLWKRLEKDGFEIVDTRMLIIGEPARGHVVAAHVEAIHRLGPEGSDEPSLSSASSALSDVVRSGPCVVLRLKRSNAVKRWVDVMRLLGGCHVTGSDAGQVPDMVGPATYATAQRLLASIFCDADTEDGPAAKPQSSSLSLGNPRRLERAACSLRETVCLLLLPCLLQHTPLSSLFDVLAGKDFSVVNVCLLQLSREQASAYLKAHGSVTNGHAHQRREQPDNLTLHRLTQEGPVVVLALECDNGVARLLSLVHPTQSASAPAAPLSSYRQRLGYGLSHGDDGHGHGLFTDTEHRQAAFASSSCQVAGSELCLFFDSLHNGGGKERDSIVAITDQEMPVEA